MNHMQFEQHHILLWYELLRPLGLSMCERIFPEMGLAFKPGQAKIISGAARRFVLEEYPKRTGDRNEDVALLGETFKMIQANADEMAALHLYEWGQKYNEDSGQAKFRDMLWQQLLQRLACVSGMNFELHPPRISEDTLSRVVGLIREEFYRANAIISRLDSARDADLAPSDQEIIKTYPPECTPFDTIEELIWLHSFRTMWASIEDIFGPEEMELLAAWGKEQAQIMKLPDNLVERP